MSITMNDLITSARERLRAAESTRDAEQAGLVAMQSRLEAGDTSISLDAVKAAVRARDDADAAVKKERTKLNYLVDEKRKDDEIDRLSEISHPTGDRRNHQESTMFTVTDPAQYSREATASGRPSYLVDLFRSQMLGDPAAGERLARHGREVDVRGAGPLTNRDVASTGVAAFVPPQYLVDLFAEYARAGRPTADLATKLPLPATGMTVNIPRVTTPTSVGVQASENSALTEASPASTTLAVPVVTVGGFADLSRQALERGELVEDVIVADLANAYNAALDAQVINGSGGSGQHLGILGTSGINAVTYTDASPTLAELWPKLASAVGQIVSGRFSGPTAIVVHPTTWAWMVSSLDSTSRPLLMPTAGGPTNSMGTTGTPVGYGTAVGQVMGVPVYLDGNIPTNLGAGTNETRIVVADLRDAFLWEDANTAPAQLKFEQPLSDQLTVRLLAYGYSAFTAGRQPKAVSVISGTGLITPAL